MKIWWLASYMRSGNTWMRFLLYSYWHGAPDTSAQVSALIPDIHEPPQFPNRVTSAQQSGEATILVKTHFPWGPKHPASNATAGAIVILRDPRDVLMSCLNFARVLGSEASAGGRVTKGFSDAAYAKDFIVNKGDSLFLSRGHGTWPDNVRSWLAFDAGPKLVLKYEDMKADPAAALRATLVHLGEETPDEDRIARAVKAASFDSMRAVEVREKVSAKARNTVFGGTTQTLRKGLYSTNKGKSGQDLDQITLGLDAAFEQHFRDALHATGYARG